MTNLYEFLNERYYSSEYHDHNDVVSKQENDDIFEHVTLNFRHTTRWKFKSTDTTKETFEKNLLNQFWSVSLFRERIIIQKDDTKVRVKFYTYNKSRAVGDKFYRISTSLNYYTYNYKTNSLYVGSMSNFHKKRKFSKSVRRSSVNYQPLSGLRSQINVMINRTLTNGIKNLESLEETNKIFNIFLNSIPGIEKYSDIYPSDNRLYKMILDKYQVKLPNNWESLVFNHNHPKLKLIRKNKNKYIDALMVHNKLKGDKIKKVLHQVTHYNPDNMHALYKLFGESFIQQQPESFLKKVFEYNYFFSDRQLTNFSKKEIKNIFEIVKLVLDHEIALPTFFDHIHFYESIKRFEPIKWKSTDLKSFQQEHLDWTERDNFYTKGDYKRIYDSRIHELLKNPIICEDLTKYYPVLLTKSRNYNEESFVQSNCVKGYVTKAGSIIISLRKGSEDSNERATIEYSVVKVREKIILNRVQTLGRFNQKLNETWDTPIALLDSIVCNMFDGDISLPMIEVKFGNWVFIAKSLFTKNDFRKYFVKDYIGDNKYLSWDRDINNNNTPLVNVAMPLPNFDITDEELIENINIE